MALEISNVSYEINNKEILKEISFSLNKGIFAVLGSNGAGKSTILKVISTLLPPTKGIVKYKGQTIKNNKFFLAELSYLPQNVGLIKDFDIVDNLHYFGLLKGCNNSELKIKISNIITDLDLEDVKNVKAYNLSGGITQKVGIALSLINSPNILILDEPFNNLDNSERNRFYTILKEVSKNSIIIISTHLISEIENVADEFIFMREGIITYKGNKQESINHYKKKFDNQEILEKEPFLNKTIFEKTFEYFTK